MTAPRPTPVDPFPPLLDAAVWFAAGRHAGQTRKGSGGPYVTHPLAVMTVLCRAGWADDAELLAAAALHDVLEDTPATPADLAAAFSPRVCELVAGMTERKRDAGGGEDPLGDSQGRAPRPARRRPPGAAGAGPGGQAAQPAVIRGGPRRGPERLGPLQRPPRPLARRRPRDRRRPPVRRDGRFGRGLYGHPRPARGRAARGGRRRSMRSGSGGNRTHDTTIFSRVLYQLSYRTGLVPEGGHAAVAAGSGREI